jgi:hypothetical protein
MRLNGSLKLRRLNRLLQHPKKADPSRAELYANKRKSGACRGHGPPARDDKDKGLLPRS